MEKQDHALKSSEARNRALLEFAYDAFIAMDVGGHIVEWNLQAEKTFGWKRAEVLGHTLSDIIIPERFREAHRQGLARYMASGVGPVLNKRIEVPARHRSGREVPVELTIYPIEQAETVIFGAFLHDISEQKKNTQLQSLQFQVTETLTKLNTLAEVVPELLQKICRGMAWSAGEFWLVDPQTTAALECRGMWFEPSAESEDFYNITTRTHFQKGVGLPGAVWESGSPRWIEDLSLDGNFPRLQYAEKAGFKSALAFPLKTAGEVVGVMAFFISEKTLLDARILEALADIGNYVGLFIQRRQAEEKLSRLYLELERKVEERTRDLAAALDQAKTANRLKDEFLATVSHELRTPLGVIIGFTDLLLDTPMSEVEKTEALETIRRNGKTQIQIISDLLDVSRIITGKIQMEIGRLDLKDSILAAVESIRIAASAKNIEVVPELDAGTGPVRGDADRVQQILWNLLSNAVKFTPKAGRVRISLKQESSRAIIEITDSGRGIEPSFLPYVFERFRQEDASTTRKYGGLGLGLAIVRHLVEAHGGTVEVVSEGLGHGAKFKVQFPLIAIHESPKSLADIPVEIPRTANKPLRGLKILTVEDDPDSRAMIVRILTAAGAEVTAAASADEAWNLFQQQIPDLLMSDISMPEQDGYEFISRIRRRPPEKGGAVPAVAFTAHARQDEKDLMQAKGFNHQISKPIRAEELVAQIQKFISTGT
jgi:PAS domain S-box-containing protein